jgi:hypothetical protein
MPTSNEYHFVTHWRVEAAPEEVADILGDVPSLPVWWPSVYLEVTQTNPGDENGVGKSASLYTKGWLPYSLRWSFRVTEANYPHGFILEAFGDLTGRGEWKLTRDGRFVNIEYDWRIRADKPLLEKLSFIFKPIFSMNHRWAMARGEESLKLELQRRRAILPGEKAAIPEPPGPTFPHNLKYPRKGNGQWTVDNGQ